MKLAIGVLCYARPIHTALTLAFAYANKTKSTDLRFFYGIPEAGEHKSPSLLRILKCLEDAGHGKLHYLPDAADKTTGGNVDNLMGTMNSLEGYDCYFKIDDDVLIGPGTDNELASLLLSKDMVDNKVYILTGQTVREHMRGPRAFGWDFKTKSKRTIVCRSRGQSPMETFAAVSYKMIPHIVGAGLKSTCENDAGTFGSYAIKLWNTGAKAALVLYPHIVMQHIGLTCTTGLKAEGSARSWAPAKCWSPAGRIVELPHFNFRVWEQSHLTGTQKAAGLNILATLQAKSKHPAIKLIIDELETYEPGIDDVTLPMGRPDSFNELSKRKKHKRKRRVRLVGRNP